MRDYHISPLRGDTSAKLSEKMIDRTAHLIVLQKSLGLIQTEQTEQTFSITA
jgi:hypothetical protein